MAMTTCRCGRRDCVDCDISQRARNNYWTGKLLVERDFRDEQRFMLGKLQRHNRRAHGCGTLCGLKVTQHPDPQCRERYVVIQPGTALDCCGHEIVIEKPEFFDLHGAFERQWREIVADRDEDEHEPDDLHTVQVCVRYAECSAEPMPAIFGDSGCGDEACQPNRIVESFDFDVRIDPDDEREDLASIRMDWESTITVAGAHRVAVDDANGLIYVLRTPQPARVFVVNAKNLNIIRSHTYDFDVSGYDIAVSPDGERVYVAVHDEDDREDAEILVLDEENLAKPINKLDLDGAHGDRVRLATGPDGNLYALNTKQKKVIAWGPEINEKLRGRAHSRVADIPDHPHAMAVSPGGEWIYVGHEGGLTVLSEDDLKLASNNDLGGVKPRELAVASVPGGDNLALLDRAGEAVLLYGWRPGAQTDQIVALGVPFKDFAHDPEQLAFSPGGKWIYVLEEDEISEDSFIQALDAHGIELKYDRLASRAFQVGDSSQEIVVTGDGLALYVPFRGEEEEAEGGVAVVELGEENCEGLLEKLVNGCDECRCGGCVVLATIPGYTPGQKIDEKRIDNLRDRKLLPSTELLTEVVQCMLESGWASGARGPIGPVGPEGPAGKGVDDDVEYVCGTSWKHGQSFDSKEVPTALVLGFRRQMPASDLLQTDPSGFPLAITVHKSAYTDQGRTLVEIPGSLSLGDLTDCDVGTFRQLDKADRARALKFAPAKALEPGFYAVTVNSELLTGLRGRGRFRSHFTIAGGKER
jgi:DNA-binding beta-propeller fold protein YncE